MGELSATRDFRLPAYYELQSSIKFVLFKSAAYMERNFFADIRANGQPAPAGSGQILPLGQQNTVDEVPRQADYTTTG